MPAFYALANPMSCNFLYIVFSLINLHNDVPQECLEVMHVEYTIQMQVYYYVYK